MSAKQLYHVRVTLELPYPASSPEAAEANVCGALSSALQKARLPARITDGPYPELAPITDQWPYHAA